MADVCRSKDVHRRTLLTAAVQSGSIEVVMAVSGFMERHNTHDQASCTPLFPNVSAVAFIKLRPLVGHLS